MHIVVGEATERRGLLVQFHEEDLYELQRAIDLYEKYGPTISKVPEWMRRLDAAIVAKRNDNRL